MSRVYRYANSLQSDSTVEKLSRKNTLPYKHIAGLYIGGKRRSVGINHWRNVLAGKPCFSIHAEVDAIRRWLQENRCHEYLSLLSDDEVIQNALLTVGNGRKGGRSSSRSPSPPNEIANGSHPSHWKRVPNSKEDGYNEFYNTFLPKKDNQCLLRAKGKEPDY